jgi:hypothetical protein
LRSYRETTFCGIDFANPLSLQTRERENQNNLVRDVGENGIKICGSFEGGEGTFCQHVSVQRNRVSNIGTQLQPGSGNGILCATYPKMPSGSTNNDIQIIQNHIDGTRHSGIFVRDARNLLIRDNDCKRIGVRSNSKQPEIRVEDSQAVKTD